MPWPAGEAGRGRAGAGFLDVACQQTNKNHKLEESLAQFTKKKKKDSLVAHQAVRHWICLKWWTLYAKIGGHSTSQRTCWKALGRRALPRLSCSAGSQDPRCNNWRGPLPPPRAPPSLPRLGPPSGRRMRGGVHFPGRLAPPRPRTCLHFLSTCPPVTRVSSLSARSPGWAVGRWGLAQKRHPRPLPSAGHVRAAVRR